MTLEEAAAMQATFVEQQLADLVTIERESYTRDKGKTWRTRFAVSTYKTVTKSGGTFRRLATYRDYGDALTALAWADAFSHGEIDGLAVARRLAARTTNDKSLPSPEDMIAWDKQGTRPEGIAEGAE